jgi:Flp pilus assembly protein TadG
MRSIRIFLRHAFCFASARDGTAAAEFAMILPVMLTVYFGVAEFTDGLTVDTRVTRAASAVADLVAQDTSINNTEMTNIFNSANAILFPYSAADTQIVVSSLTDAGNGNGRVVWSSAHNTAARGVNSLVPIPAGLISTDGSVIFSEVRHNYQSPAGQLIYGTVTLSDTFITRPRRVAQVTRTTN